ncbi:MAG TPA: hypothetical protein DF383_04515 [Deltaproteobacteria bacterium]|nr:hypothetical protein [Deltaproteobacteria bacterium]
MHKTEKINTVSFTVKGQVVIPRRFRKEFGIGEGTRAAVYSTSEGILLKPITGKHIKSLRGSLKGSGAMDVFLAERKREIKIHWLTDHHRHSGK